MVYLSHDPSFWTFSNVEPDIVVKAHEYVLRNGEENIKNLFYFLANRVLGLPISYKEPEEIPWEGIYHPRAERVFKDITDYLSRYKEKENKIGHLVVFVTDGSGSMAVHQRMIATKGAIMSLLMDCYQKRDKVAMILFRKFKAEVVLSPTSSVELAHKKLKDLPTGGNTPLSAGLFTAYNLY